MPQDHLRVDIALWLANLGFRIFPLHPNSKKPVFTRWPQRATTNQDTIRAWWEANPDYNIGIACGRADTELGLYLIVLDYDMKEGKLGGETLAKHRLLGYLDTFCTKTPNGYHAYYWSEHNIRNSVSRIAPHVDVRGYHGYVVGPGSIVDGVTYTYLKDSGTTIATLPRLLVAAAAKSTSTFSVVTVETPPELLDSPRAQERIKEWLINDAPMAIAGRRGNETTFKIAQRVRAMGASLAVAQELILNWWNEDKADPPWSTEELNAIIENAYKYADRTPPAGSADPVIEFADTIDAAKVEQLRASGAIGSGPMEEKKAEEPKPEPPKATLKDPAAFREAFKKKYPHIIFLEDLQKLPLIAAQWIVENFILADAVNGFFGAGATGKDLLLLQLGIARNYDKLWLGLKVTPGRTLYLPGEDNPNELRRREDAITRYYGGAKTKLRPAEFAIAPMFGPDALLARFDHNSGIVEPTENYDKLRQLIKNFRADLVLLGNRVNIFSVNQNDDAQAAQCIGLLSALNREFGCTIIMPGHVSIAGAQRGESGSVQWSNGCRMRTYLRRLLDKEGNEAHPTVRELVVMKANWSASGLVLPMRWHNGVFQPLTELDRQAREDWVQNTVFMELMYRFTREKRNVSPNPRAPNYVLNVFSKEVEATGTSVDELDKAMRELLRVRRIGVEEYKDTHYRAKERLVVLEEEKRESPLD